MQRRGCGTPAPPLRRASPAFPLLLSPVEEAVLGARGRHLLALSRLPPSSIDVRRVIAGLEESEARLLIGNFLLLCPVVALHTSSRGLPSPNCHSRTPRLAGCGLCSRPSSSSSSCSPLRRPTTCSRHAVRPTACGNSRRDSRCVPVPSSSSSSTHSGHRRVRTKSGAGCPRRLQCATGESRPRTRSIRGVAGLSSPRRTVRTDG